MTLSERIKEQRTKSGLSQEKVAELIGISRQAVTKWESGQSVPSMANLITLAGIFQVSLSELTDGVKNNTPIGSSIDTQDTPKKVERKNGTIKLISAIILFIIGLMTVTIISNMNVFDISRLTGVWIQSANLLRLGVQVVGSMAIIAAIVLFVLYLKGRKTIAP